MMNRYPPLTDESVVVAFLSYTDERRDEMASYLAHSHAARELLCMAQEALDALHPPSHRAPRTPQKRQRKYDAWTKKPL